MLTKGRIATVFLSTPDSTGPPRMNVCPDVGCDNADPKHHTAQQGMLLALLIAQRVPSSRSAMAMEQFMTCMIRDIIADAWPDDVAAQMVHM